MSQPQRLPSGVTKVRKTTSKNVLQTFLFNQILILRFCSLHIVSAVAGWLIVRAISIQMSSSDHLSEDLNTLANWRAILTLVTFLIASELEDDSILERDFILC